jgi:hypothetical protein
MNEKIKIISKKILAVEGKDECNFFQALLKHSKIESILWFQYIENIKKDPGFSVSNEAVQLIDIGGKDKFKEELEALTVLQGFDNIEKMGFIRDAEINPAESAFTSICNILKSLHLPFPPASNEVIKNIKPSVGVFIMPDNKNSGMLESLCLKALENQKIKNCIDDFISCFYIDMNQSEKDKFNEPKSRVLSYLASRSPIVNSLGLSAQNGYWDFSHGCFDEIKKFLRDLF